MGKVRCTRFSWSGRRDRGGSGLTGSGARGRGRPRRARKDGRHPHQRRLRPDPRTRSPGTPRARRRPGDAQCRRAAVEGVQVVATAVRVGQLAALELAYPTFTAVVALAERRITTCNLGLAPSRGTVVKAPELQSRSLGAADAPEVVNLRARGARQATRRQRRPAPCPAGSPCGQPCWGG